MPFRCGSMDLCGIDFLCLRVKGCCLLSLSWVVVEWMAIQLSEGVFGLSDLLSSGRSSWRPHLECVSVFDVGSEWPYVSKQPYGK